MTHQNAHSARTRTHRVMEDRMLGRTKSSDTLGEHAIFGDEEAAQLLAEVKELRSSIAELHDRVHAQFTTIAAHAEIAREQSSLARGEARADLERTRETLISLVEQVRAETAGVHVPGSAPGPSREALIDRIVAVDERVEKIAETVRMTDARQRELAETVAAFIDTMLAEKRGEPVAGLSLA